MPLDTATVQVIDAGGARTDATLTHGATDDVLVATLPPLAAGETTLRWRLVGPDGHPLTGRVALTVSAAVDHHQPDHGTSGDDRTWRRRGPASDHDATTPVDDTARGRRVERRWRRRALPVPDALRWVLRYGSYLAVMAIIGIVLADRYIWRGAAEQPILRRIVRWSLVTVAVLALLQLLVVASDIADAAPWSALGSLDAALNTSAGIALAARMLLAGVLWALLFRTPAVDDEVRAARSRSAPSRSSAPGRGPDTRRPSAGPSSACPSTSPTTPQPPCGSPACSSSASSPPSSSARPRLAPVVERLSTAASVAVAVIVLTGIIQSCGWSAAPATSSPPTTASTWPSSSSSSPPCSASPHSTGAPSATVNSASAGAASGGVDTQRLRRSILVEFALGLIVIAITSAMVVSPPATADADRAAMPLDPHNYIA